MGRRRLDAHIHLFYVMNVDQPHATGVVKNIGRSRI